MPADCKVGTGKLTRVFWARPPREFDARTVQLYWDRAYKKESSAWRKQTEKAKKKAKKAVRAIGTADAKRNELLQELGGNDGLTYPQWLRELNPSKHGRTSKPGSQTNHMKFVPDRWFSLLRSMDTSVKRLSKIKRIYQLEDTDGQPDTPKSPKPPKGPRTDSTTPKERVLVECQGKFPPRGPRLMKALSEMF